SRLIVAHRRAAALVEDRLARVLPELVVAPPSAGLLRHEGRREFGEALGQPLIAIRREADLMSPPLMSELVRADVVDEVLRAGEAEGHALRAGEEGEIRDVNQRRPRLPEVPLRLLRDGDVLVRKRAEIVIAGARGVDAVGERGL